MPSYVAHLFFSLLFVLPFLSFEFPLLMVSIPFLLIGAILPDVDHPKSKVSKGVRNILLLLFLLLPYYYRTPESVVLAVVGMLFAYFRFSIVRVRHRGITHSAVFVLVTGGILFAFLHVFSFPFLPGGFYVMGVSSHILLDWIAPAKRKK